MLDTKNIVNKILGKNVIVKDGKSKNQGKKCPHCGGSGSDASDEYSCPYCDGTGMAYEGEDY